MKNPPTELGNKTQTELEERISHLEARLAVVENLMKTKPKETESAGNKEAIVAAKVKDIGVQDCVLLSLGLKGAQTKQHMMKTMDIWGKPYGSWFNGGNFNNRLLKKGMVRADGQDEQGQDIYCLTMNGQHTFEEKLVELEG
jgi:hypothetical protein